MFTPEERERVRERVLDLARSDDRITGAAVTGSAAWGKEDRWSDVDVFLGVAENNSLADVLTDFTDRLAGELRPVHHWDLRAGSAVYRVFLLPSCLQVDVAFTPASDFGARSPRFRTVFGDPVEREPNPTPGFDELAGRGWLDVVHANASIERGLRWRAEYHVSSVHDQTLALACLRLGKNPFYAKGSDHLPSDVTRGLEDSLVRSLAPEELRHSLQVAAACFLREVALADDALAGRLEGPLHELVAG